MIQIEQELVSITHPFSQKINHWSRPEQIGGQMSANHNLDLVTDTYLWLLFGKNLHTSCRGVNPGGLGGVAHPPKFKIDRFVGQNFVIRRAKNKQVFWKQFKNTDEQNEVMLFAFHVRAQWAIISTGVICYIIYTTVFLIFLAT